MCWIVIRTRLIWKRYVERGRSNIQRKYGLVIHCLHCSTSILYIGKVWLVYIVRVWLVYILWYFTIFDYVVSFKRNCLVVFLYFYGKYLWSSLIFNHPVICVGNQIIPFHQNAHRVLNFKFSPSNIACIMINHCCS